MAGFDRARLESLGFRGFMSFADIRAIGSSVVPDAPGVYAVLCEPGLEPVFLERSLGGRFKGEDPTVATELLRSSWIGDTSVLYFGKSGSLRRRIREYSDFGLGKPVGHRGGRYIWQLEGSSALRVAWRPCQAGEAERTLEAELLSTFAREHGALPFANLVR